MSNAFGIQRMKYEIVFPRTRRLEKGKQAVVSCNSLKKRTQKVVCLAVNLAHF